MEFIFVNVVAIEKREKLRSQRETVILLPKIVRLVAKPWDLTGMYNTGDGQFMYLWPSQ